jgi:beta-lactamase regulating signal transducer with metallopeptidase domain
MRLDRIWLWMLVLCVVIPIIIWTQHVPPTMRFATTQMYNVSALNAPISTQTNSMSFIPVKSVVLPLNLAKARISASVTGGIGFVRLITNSVSLLSNDRTSNTSDPSDTSHNETQTEDRKHIYAEFEFRNSEPMVQEMELIKRSQQIEQGSRAPTAQLVDLEFRISNPRYEINLHEFALT